MGPGLSSLLADIFLQEPFLISPLVGLVLRLELPENGVVSDSPWYILKQLLGLQ